MSSTEAEKALSAGFISNLLNVQGNEAPQTEGKQPVLQVVHLSPMGKDTSRWKIALSDGSSVLQGMLSTQCAELAESKAIQNGSITRLKQFTASNLKGRWVVIVIQIEVLKEFGVLSKITIQNHSGEQGSAQQPAAMSGQGFYGNSNRAAKQEPAARSSLPSRPMVSSHHGTIHPIDALSPYGSKWTIKARVTSKSPIKEWHNEKSEGKLFSFTLLDESGEIRATAFNDQCTMYFDMIEEGGVYYVSSPCTVKMAQKKFSNVNNDYELSLNNDTVIEKAEDQQDVPQVRYNFTTIADLAQVEKDAVVDVIGVLRDSGKVDEIRSKTSGRPFQKRELTIVDNSNVQVRLTIWGNTAQEFDVPLESVIAFKGAKVSDFNVRSLSLLSSGTMVTNPDVDEAHRLKGWYDAQGKMEEFSTHEGSRAGGAGNYNNTPAKTIEQLKDQQVGMSGEAEYFDVNATIVFFHHKNKTYSYDACPSPPENKCNKKVMQTSDGTWICDSCGFTAPEPQYRYVLGMSVEDHTGQVRMSCFDEIGKQLIGHDAKEMRQLEDTDESERYWQEAMWNTYRLRCRASMEHYKDEERVRYTILSARPIDYVQDSKRLIDVINAYG